MANTDPEVNGPKVKITGLSSALPRGVGEHAWFLARDVIYTSHAYDTMSVSVCLSVCDGSALAHYS